MSLKPVHLLSDIFNNVIGALRVDPQKGFAYAILDQSKLPRLYFNVKLHENKPY